MKKNPLFVAVSNQKGGVGKSTMLITLASLLNYSMGRNVPSLIVTPPSVACSI